MSEALIDPETWEMFKSMTDPAFLVEIMDVYLMDSPELIAQMHSGLEAGDIEVVRRAAHSLKSNSASFGANRLSAVARELEMIAKSGTLDGAEAKLKLIETEYTLLVPVLEKMKSEY